MGNHWFGSSWPVSVHSLDQETVDTEALRKVFPYGEIVFEVILAVASLASLSMSTSSMAVHHRVQCTVEVKVTSYNRLSDLKVRILFAAGSRGWPFMFKRHCHPGDG